jgi:hypothetical protein
LCWTIEEMGRKVELKTVMTRVRSLLAATATLLLVGAAGQAHAQSLSGLRIKPAEPRSEVRTAGDERWLATTRPRR